jgi:uncharacterized repeat protein (TIGR02543 family)
MPAGNTTLYAIWTINTYTVTYNNNGGAGTLTDNSSPYNYNSTVIVLSNTFTKIGYSFVKWNTAANGSGTDYSPAGSFAATANTVLYAQWTIKQYTITFTNNGNGSTVPSTPTDIDSGIPTEVMATPDGGYRFAGWSVVSGIGISFIDSTDATTSIIAVSGNATIRASFDIDSVEIIPDIDSLRPNPQYVNQSPYDTKFVDVYGANFGNSQGSGKMLIGATSVTAASLWSDTHITDTIPASLNNGIYQFKLITALGDTTISVNSFRLCKLRIK